MAIINKIMMNSIYPDIIKGLPEADIPFEGVKGWLSQSGDHQIVFFEIEPIGKVAEHAHAAQWGFVIDGEIELTIGDEIKTYKSGDHYYIPENIIHSATFKKRTFVVDVFADKDRYKSK